MTEEERENWLAFRSNGILWFVNRTIHLFGWEIYYEFESNEYSLEPELQRVGVCRTQHRGFSRESEEAGFSKLTNYLSLEIELLENDLDA